MSKETPSKKDSKTISSIKNETNTPKTIDVQPQSTKKDLHVSKEKPVVTLPATVSPQIIVSKPTEPPVKKQEILIKMDYLKSTKIEKSRDDVSRILEFNAASKAETEIKTEPVDAVKTNGIQNIKGEKETDEKSASKSTSENAKCNEIVKPKLEETPVKIEIKKEPGSSSKHSSNNKPTHHHSSSHHKSHTSSSHNKSSSATSSHRSSSSRDCSRCYKRSKIKKVNIGVQVRPSEPVPPKPPTRKLEFEASHRIGVNRRPVTIDTNLSYLKYGRFYHIEVHPNGGASIVHMYQDELDELNQEEMAELVDEFFELVFSEDENGYAYHVMGIVHDAARYLPDLLEHMAENYSNLAVKAGVLGRNNDIETCTMLQYYEQVQKSYSEGTVRYGPLHQISLVGKVHEEVGGYFPDLLGKLDQNPFLKKVIKMKLTIQ